MSDIHVFNHHAMATQFQVRIADEEKNYAAQTAQAAFALTDKLESHLSRFRANSDIAQIAQLAPGETLRLSEPVFACLEIAKKMETGHARRIFRDRRRVAIAARAAAMDVAAGTIFHPLRRRQAANLISARSAKGLRSTGWRKFCANGVARRFCSSRAAAAFSPANAPPEIAGWSCGLGDDNSPHRYWLKKCSLSGSGLAVKGQHILDPRTGRPARGRIARGRCADTAAESDALSTACMVLDEADFPEVISNLSGSLVWLQDGGGWREFGDRKLRGTKIV